MPVEVLVGMLADRLSDVFRAYERFVVGSGLSKSLNSYTRAVLKVVVAASIAAVVLYAILIPVLGFDPTRAVLGLLVLALIPPSAFLISLTLLPRILYINRGFKLEAKFYRLLFFLSLLLIAGTGITKALLGLRELKEELKDFSIELDIMDSRLSLGYDLAEVVDYIATITPCRSLSNLLITVLNLEKSGYTLMPVITNLISSYFVSLRSRMEEAMSYLSMLTEVFIAIVLLFPMLVSIMSSSAALVPVGGLDPYTLLCITLLIIVPVASLLYYIAVDYVLSGVAA